MCGCGSSWQRSTAMTRNSWRRCAASGIEPKALARKIVMIMNREVQEELFFHADPHPANLVVMPNNEICFIDFGAIGRFSTQTRKTLREFQYHMIKGDIGRMVNCALSLIGPLPPMDVERIRVEMEKIYADGVYAMNSATLSGGRKARRKAGFGSLRLSRQFSMPASFEAIQFSEQRLPTMPSSSDCTRISMSPRYGRPTQREAPRRRENACKRGCEQRLRGPTDMDYYAMEQFGDMVTQFVFQLQRNIENPIIHFRNIVGKIAYIASLLLKLGYLVGVAVGHRAGRRHLFEDWFGHEIDWAPSSNARQPLAGFSWP